MTHTVFSDLNHWQSQTVMHTFTQILLTDFFTQVLCPHTCCSGSPVITSVQLPLADKREESLKTMAQSFSTYHLLPSPRCGVMKDSSRSSKRWSFLQSSWVRGEKDEKKRRTVGRRACYAALLLVWGPADHSDCVHCSAHRSNFQEPEGEREKKPLALTHFNTNSSDPTRQDLSFLSGNTLPELCVIQKPGV